jgi:hypothetical protein
VLCICVVVAGRKCPLDVFTCDNIRCVSMSKHCDGENDCGDFSDERTCLCDADQFQCDDGMCIAAVYRCDQDSDCADYSDEIGCSKYWAHGSPKQGR